jgi:hypothetical protein
MSQGMPANMAHAVDILILSPSEDDLAAIRPIRQFRDLRLSMGANKHGNQTG